MKHASSVLVPCQAVVDEQSNPVKVKYAGSGFIGAGDGGGGDGDGGGGEGRTAA